MNDAVTVSKEETTQEEMFDRMDEYAKYVAQKIETSFSFSDWYEQTYGEPLSQDFVDMWIEAIRDNVLDHAENHVMALNRDKV